MILLNGRGDNGPGVGLAAGTDNHAIRVQFPTGPPPTNKAPRNAGSLF